LNHHTNDNRDNECGLCNEKLSGAHPVLVEWFYLLKQKEPLVHISWAWRGKTAQNQMFKDGSSHAKFPMSPHNNVEENAVPCSLALDIFQLVGTIAVFNPVFYAKVNEYNEKNGYPITWGGRFRTLGDANHFQIDRIKHGAKT
jgi:hypothetical protein